MTDAANTNLEEDGEIAAIVEVSKALKPLSSESQKRVLDWAYSKFLGTTSAIPRQGSPIPQMGAPHIFAADENLPQSATPNTFEDFVDLYDATQPSTASDKVLVAAYWFKMHQNQEAFTSQPINSALKDLGHGVSHMPSALAALEKQQPALVRQMQKSGKSAQARKTYKITDAGIKAVQAMIKTSNYTPAARSTVYIGGQERKFEATTNSLAIKMNCNDCATLIKAAAIHLSLVQGKTRFSRQDLLLEMKDSSYFKETYRGNLTYYIKSLIKDGFLNEPQKDTYAILPNHLPQIEAQFA